MSELFTLLIQRGLCVVLGLSERLSVGHTVLRLVIVEVMHLSRLPDRLSAAIYTLYVDALQVGIGGVSSQVLELVGHKVVVLFTLASLSQDSHIIDQHWLHRFF
jgi:hypothetical protein